MKVISPGLPEFRYVRAESIGQVSELLKNGKEARLLLGGTDVFVQMRDGALSSTLLIDVKHLPGMDVIARNRDDSLTIGAAVSLNVIAANEDVEKSFSPLAEAARSVGSYQLRSRATMGGNLCNASPAADTAPAALVQDAVLVAHGSKGERRVPVKDFFVGPGQNALMDDELLMRIEIPAAPERSVGRYFKLGRNAEGDLAIVGVAVLGYPDSQAPSGYQFRIALSSIAPTPIRVPDAEQILAEEKISDKTIAAAAEAARNAAKPIDDVRASAGYRQAMVEVFTRRALRAVWNTLRREG
jgi:CO/xanthine dehydrogenase FAD-binding subunit